MKKDFRRRSGHRAFLSLAAALAGGSTFTSCDTKIKTAVVGGLETTFLGLFNPAIYLDSNATGGFGGAGTGSGSLFSQFP